MSKARYASLADVPTRPRLSRSALYLLNKKAGWKSFSVVDSDFDIIFDCSDHLLLYTYSRQDSSLYPVSLRPLGASNDPQNTPEPKHTFHHSINHKHVDSVSLYPTFNTSGNVPNTSQKQEVQHPNGKIILGYRC